MTYLKSFFIASLLFPLVVQAQENTVTAPEMRSDSLSDNEKTVDFFLVNQVALAYRCFVSDNHAWSVSADVNTSASTESRENTPRRQVQDVARNSFAISIGPQIWWLTSSSKARVRLFIGAGPTFRFARSYERFETRDQTAQPSSSNVTTWTTQTLEVGVLLTAGLEVWVTQPLSLIAKYDLSGTYGRETSTNDYSGGGYDDSTKRWKLSLSQIRLGLGIHF